MAYVIALSALAVGLFLYLCIYQIPFNPSLFFSAVRDMPLKYLAVELTACFLTVLIYLRYNISLLFIFYLIITYALIAASFIDIESLIVPNGLVAFLFFAGIINLVIQIGFNGQTSHAINHLSASAVAGGLFYAIAFVTNGKMGGGDTKLMAALGICLGFRLILLTIFLCFLFGALYGIILILIKAKSRTSAIAFAPFISLGAVIAILYGSDIIDLYLKLILAAYP